MARVLLAEDVRAGKPQLSRADDAERAGHFRPTFPQFLRQHAHQGGILDEAVVNVDAYPNRPFDGVVTEVGSSPILPNDPDLQGLTTSSDAIVPTSQGVCATSSHGPMHGLRCPTR